MKIKEIYQFLNDIPNRMNENTNFSTAPIEYLLAKLDNPHIDLNYIHIAGTNGKGSTLTYLQNILNASSIHVGAFTSPHLIEWRESIQIGVDWISIHKFEELFHIIYPKILQCEQEGFRLSAFEIICALAFLHFKQENCEIVLVEVGMGGKNDATNCIPKPLLTIFTPISLDHTNFLGNSLEEIAIEKSGIIKEGSTVLSAKQTPIVTQVLKKICQNKHIAYNEAHSSKLLHYSMNEGQTFQLVDNCTYTTLLLGSYQIQNASLAIQAAKFLKPRYPSLTEKSIQEGIKSTKWPARFELLSMNPLLFFDGSHNEAGISQLVHSFELLFPNHKIHFIIGMLQDKNVLQCLEFISPIMKSLTVVEVPNPRTISLAQWSAILQKYNLHAKLAVSIPEAIQEKISSVHSSELICICGSLYTYPIVKSYFNIKGRD